MSTEPATRLQEVSRGKMWFCVWGAAVAWILLGIADVLITWRACLHQEKYGGASSHPGLLTLNIVLFFVLLAIAVAAGVMSYRTWHRLSGSGNLFNSESPGRHEYMAMVGVLLTITIGMGIIWLGIPLMIISLCVRTR